jgi:hypothetical protein
MKTLTRDLRGRALHETPLPIPYDAGAMPGARVLGEDGREYVSQRWPGPLSPYEWISAVQIAEDVSANVVRIIEAPLSVTVHATNPAADFQSVKQALEYFSTRIPGVNLPPLSLGIHILTGHVETEQILLLEGTYFGVRITADDEEVIVDESGFDKSSTSLPNEYPYIETFVGYPAVSCVFRSNQELDIPGGTTTGLLMRSGVYRNGLDTDLSPPPAGFTHFDTNLRVGAASGVRMFSWSKHSNAQVTGVQSDGPMLAVGDISGCGVYGVRGAQNCQIRIQNANCRTVTGVDSPNDISVTLGGWVYVSQGDSGTLGGVSQPSHVTTNDGLIIDTRSGAPVTGVIAEGSNANGSWVRYASGLQICTHRVTVSLTIDLALMGGFRSPGQAWTFPAAFKAGSEPIVLGRPDAGTGFGFAAQPDTNTPTIGRWAVTAVTTQTSASRTVALTAIGPWR